MNDKPLVSVRILTYNSSKYIVETLDSVNNQTYDNIELIISDDYSKDNTVEICRDWLRIKESRFSKVKLLTVTENTGVCANSNRSLKAVTGEWIKGLGGDDCLVPDAIEKFVKFVLDNKCEVCASDIIYMDDNSNICNVNLGGTYADFMDNLKMPFSDQFNLIFHRTVVPGPLLFYSKKIANITGGPNPLYGNFDEQSMQLKILEAGFRIYPLEAALVKYRVHDGSLARPKSGDMKARKVRGDYYNILAKNELIPKALKRKKYILAWDLYVQTLKNKNKGFAFLQFFSPGWYKEKIRIYREINIKYF